MYNPEKFRGDEPSNKRRNNTSEDRDDVNNERVNNLKQDGDETLVSDNLSVWLLAVDAEVLSVADAAKNI